jgi:hypothetical protein
MIKCISYSTNESVLINEDDIMKVKAAERGTAVIHLRNACSEHVMESVADVERMLTGKGAIKTPKIVNSGPGRVNGG